MQTRTIEWFHHPRNLQFLHGPENNAKGKAVTAFIKSKMTRSLFANTHPKQDQIEWVNCVAIHWAGLSRDFRERVGARFANRLDELLD
jgi:hypothetical protein